MNESYSEQLDMLFEDIKLPGKDYSTFLKVDISGIQDYIFHVQSDKAARTLKGRSFLVQALGWLAEENIKQAVNDDCYTIYNGGGNVYMLVNEEEALLDGMEGRLNDVLTPYSLYICISTVSYATKDFRNCKRALEQQSAKDKQRKYQGQHEAFHSFELPRDLPDREEKNQEDKWHVLTKQLVKHKGYTIETADGSQQDLLGADGVIRLGDFQLKIVRNPTEDKKLDKSILVNLPTWDNDLLDDGRLKERINKEYKRQAKRDGTPERTVEAGQILEFSALAALAGKRTGTPKLGILKMDVDNLGMVFGDLPDAQAMTYLSKAFKWFFEERFCEIWNEAFEYNCHARGSDGKYQTKGNPQKKPYSQNLYVVFAGGDDCFVLGGWDTILAFADRIESEFQQFVLELKQHKRTEFLSDRKVTLSAGVELVGPKHPTILFARAANEAIDTAKDYEKERKDEAGKLSNGKHRICLFNEALSWEDYRNCQTWRDRLAGLISSKRCNRSLFYRIQHSSAGFQEMPHPSALQYKQGKFPEEWHLYHFLGRMRNTSSGTFKTVDELVKAYAPALLKVYKNNGGNTHMTYPLAARLAEFSTRTIKLSSDE